MSCNLVADRVGYSASWIQSAVLLQIAIMPCHAMSYHCQPTCQLTQLQKAMPLYCSGEMERMMMFGMKIIFLYSDGESKVAIKFCCLYPLKKI